jgi:hypothetical protein
LVPGHQLAKAAALAGGFPRQAIASSGDCGRTP